MLLGARYGLEHSVAFLRETAELKRLHVGPEKSWHCRALVVLQQVSSAFSLSCTSTELSTAGSGPRAHRARRPASHIGYHVSIVRAHLRVATRTHTAPLRPPVDLISYYNLVFF